MIWLIYTGAAIATLLGFHAMAPDYGYGPMPAGANMAASLWIALGASLFVVGNALFMQRRRLQELERKISAPSSPPGPAA